VGGGYCSTAALLRTVAGVLFCGSALGLFLLWNGAAGGLAFVAAFLGAWVWVPNLTSSPTW